MICLHSAIRHYVAKICVYTWSTWSVLDFIFRLSFHSCRFLLLNKLILSPHLQKVGIIFHFHHLLGRLTGAQSRRSLTWTWRADDFSNIRMFLPLTTSCSVLSVHWIDSAVNDMHKNIYRCSTSVPISMPISGKIDIPIVTPIKMRKKVYFARMTIKSYSLECQNNFHANVRRESMKRIRHEFRFHITFGWHPLNALEHIKFCINENSFQTVLFMNRKEFFHERWIVSFDRYHTQTHRTYPHTCAQSNKCCQKVYFLIVILNSELVAFSLCRQLNGKTNNVINECSDCFVDAVHGSNGPEWGIFNAPLTVK